MFNRYGRAASALFGITLYGGPILAGLAGHDLAVLPVFAALFLIFVVVTRKPDLSSGTGWAGLIIMAVVQITLVALAYGAGVVTGALLGPVALAQWPPLALSAAAAVFATWAFRDAAEMDVMLDSAIRALEGFDDTLHAAVDPPWPAALPDAEAAVGGVLSDLRGRALTDAEAIENAVARLEAAVGVEGFDPLYDAAGEAPGNEPIVDLALLRFAARPAINAALIARGDGGLAPMLLLNTPDAHVRAEACRQVHALAVAGAPVGQLPDPTWMAELDARFPGEGFAALAALREAET